MVVEEYEPEFGMEDVPQLSELDLASVEGFLRASGMLGMRFEDRGGGFGAMRERMGVGNEEGMVEDNGEEKKNDAPAVEVDNNYSTYMMADVESTVPEIFFSPYFEPNIHHLFHPINSLADEEPQLPSTLANRQSRLSILILPVGTINLSSARNTSRGGRQKADASLEPIQRRPIQRPSTVRYRFDSIES